jgi:hypothetical protein
MKIDMEKEHVQCDTIYCVNPVDGHVRKLVG